MKVLVTGATDGLGKAAVSSLARRGETLLVHGRFPAHPDARAAAHRGSAVPDRERQLGLPVLGADVRIAA
jgi:NAD(P)-dependent dehydrogenase (short-subunit alcohol dehydrogenase family)